MSASIAAFVGGFGISVAPDTLRLPFALQMERTGSLTVEDDGAGGIWLSLSREAPPHQDGVALAALRAVHPDRSLSRAVKAGFRGDHTLVLMTRMSAAELDPPAMAAALRLLARIADEVLP